MFKVVVIIIGEGRFFLMFIFLSFKKGKEIDIVKCEGIFDEVLVEVIFDDIDRERYRRRK